MRVRRILIVSVAAVLWSTPATLCAATDSQSVVTASTTDTQSPAPPWRDAGVSAEVATDSSPPAATPASQETQSWWQVLVSELISLIVIIFVPVLSTLVATLLRRWKINIEFDQVNSIAKKAAGWAEQKADSALKEGCVKTAGADKMKLAMNFANELADKYKLPAKATDKLQDLIEASLGREKIKVASAKSVSQPDTATT